MTQPLPSLDGLSWPQVRALARDLVASAPAAEVISTAVPLLAAPVVPHRQLATYLLGFTSAEHPANLERLRRRVTLEPSWEVQEALAQAFDAWCAATGYVAALPTIDAWLGDPHPNASRAVSEACAPG
jgi:hypothetical protein